MKKLFLLVFATLLFACGPSESSYSARKNTEELKELTKDIIALKRESAMLNDDIVKQKTALIELMKFSTEANDELAKKILIERASEVMKIGDAKSMKLREINGHILEHSDRIREIISDVEFRQRARKDTARNILSVDSVQEGN